jgi:hypothetical protein
MISHLLVGMALAVGQVQTAPAGTPPQPADSADSRAPSQDIKSASLAAFADLPTVFEPMGYWSREVDGALPQAASEPGGPIALEVEAAGGPTPGNPPGLTTKQPTQPTPNRRALPPPFDSPPFPNAEYQGFPLIGVPVDTTRWPLMKCWQGTLPGDVLDSERIRVYGWLNGSANLSNCRNSNTISSYWVLPNSAMLDQAVLRCERQVDTVQTSHLDWGFRASWDYGIDYRYFTAGGWLSDQLLVHNRLYGVDPTEQYFNLYVPCVAQGMIVTIGRWIATPDIETQFSPDNYMGSHSIQFTVDVYTETGVMATVMLDKQWTVQGCLHAGADMAPWYPGAVPTGMFGVRWVSQDNNDSFYTVLNAINNAQFRYFDLRGVPAGHHNYNIIQTTWQHRFNEKIHTKTEVYLLWENKSSVGGTPSIGPVKFNSGGGLGAFIPGLSLDYSALNYTMFELTKKDFIVFRNEWAKDETGFRYGFKGNYTGNAFGWTHNFTPLLQVRPEIGYYRNWTTPAFDNGLRKDLILAAFDVTLRF